MHPLSAPCCLPLEAARVATADALDACDKPRGISGGGGDVRERSSSSGGGARERSAWRALRPPRFPGEQRPSIVSGTPLDCSRVALRSILADALGADGASGVGTAGAPALGARPFGVTAHAAAAGAAAGAAAAAEAVEEAAAPAAAAVPHGAQLIGGGAVPVSRGEESGAPAPRDEERGTVRAADVEAAAAAAAATAAPPAAPSPARGPFTRAGTTRRSHILHASATSEFFHVPWYVARDDAADALVVVVRGTLSPEDLVTDGLALPLCLQNDPDGARVLDAIVREGGEAASGAGGAAAVDAAPAPGGAAPRTPASISRCAAGAP
jgi:hypothetical protein